MTPENNAALTRLLIAVAPRPKRRRRIPRQSQPTAIMRDYYAAIRALLRDVRDEVMTAWSLRTDAITPDQLRRAIERSERGVNGVVNARRLEDIGRKIANATSTHQRRQLSKQAVAALGIDLVGQSSSGVAAILDAFVAENVSLIRGVAKRVASDMEEVITRGLGAGSSTKSIAKEIQSRFGVAEKRALIIARDQVGKLNGQINAQRQEDLGVREFTWRSSHDERVRGNPSGKYPNARPSHYDRDGKKYSYSAPPDGELPGVPILCRCYAEPVFDGLLSE